MTEPTEPQHMQSSEQHRVQVRRAPRFGVFMGLGAVIGAAACGLVSFLAEPGTQPDGTVVDTTPVIGLMIVVGFVVGAAVGAIVAVVLERTVGRRLRQAEVERTAVVTVEEPVADADAAGPESSVEAAHADDAVADGASDDDTETKP